MSSFLFRKSLSDPANRLSGFDMIPFDKDMGFALVERMRAIGAGHGATPAQVALAWVLSKDIVSSVLVGASRIDQLDDNLAAAGLALTADEIAELDAATRPVPTYPATVVAVADQPIARALAARPGQN